MKVLKIAALALAALVLPALLASATYIMSANSLDSPAGAAVRVRRAIASPSPERDRAEDTRRDDISGPCDEAEHADDPRCTGSGEEDFGSDDNSGSGSDDSDSDNSGSGSDGSDSDNSGSGSDSSGSGSDGSGSDSDNSGSGSENSGSGSDSSGSGSSGGDD